VLEVGLFLCMQIHPGNAANLALQPFQVAYKLPPPITDLGNEMLLAISRDSVPHGLDSTEHQTQSLIHSRNVVGEA
jgi:hypothetical protein